MKGLEFHAVAVIRVADGIVPAPNALIEATGDPVARAQDLQGNWGPLFIALAHTRDHLLAVILKYRKAPDGLPSMALSTSGAMYKRG